MTRLLRIFAMIVLVVLPQVLLASKNEFGIVEKRGQCVDEFALQQRRILATQRKAKQLPKFRTRAIAKKTVLVDVSQSEQPITGVYSLPVDISSLKTKTYLMGKNLTLVGRGFDDESLMDKAAELELFGFRDVAVLANGRRAVALKSLETNLDEPASNTLHFIDASVALSAAATSILPKEYLFLTIDNELESLSNFGIESVNVESDSADSLLNTVSAALEENRFSKIVVVLNGSSQKSLVLGSSKLSNLENIWVLAGDRKALLKAMENTKINPVRLRTHRLTCASG